MVLLPRQKSKLPLSKSRSEATSSATVRYPLKNLPRCMARGQDMSHATGTPDAPTQEGFITLRSPLTGGITGVYTIL